MTQLRYLSLLNFEDDWLADLRHRVPDVEVLQIPSDKPDDVAPEIWPTVDVLHTSGTLPDAADVPRLRWVQLDTSGADHVRDGTLWRSPVQFTTIGGISPVPLAEYVLFTLLGMAHRLPALLALRESRAWPSPQRRWSEFRPAPVAGATLGILGYGRIGREIGRVAGAFGMNVIGLSRSGRQPTEEQIGTQMLFGARPSPDTDVLVRPVSDLLEVAAGCDFLVVICPLTPQTEGLVGASVLMALRPGAVVVNVSRGGVVDEHALRAALRSGHLAGAALDVFLDEPLPPDDEWWREPNVVISPHSAGLSACYEEQVMDLVVENLNRLVSGCPLLNLVDRERAY